MKNLFRLSKTADKQMRKGDQALKVINDPLVKEALSGIEDTIFYNIKTSKYKNVDEREELYRMLKLCDKFKEQFALWVRDGKAARAKLEEKTSKII